jgi:hypothetical protein
MKDKDYFIIDDKYYSNEIYKNDNYRKICKLKNNADKYHCHYDKINDKYLFIISNDYINYYFRKLLNELLNNNIKSNELLNIDGYYVFDIIDKNIYKKRDD